MTRHPQSSPLSPYPPLSLFFLLTTLLALAATAAQAQTPMRGGARRMELLFKDITLTPAQQAKVDSIQARYRSERPSFTPRSEEHTSELQSQSNLVCRLLLAK